MACGRSPPSARLAFGALQTATKSCAAIQARAGVQIEVLSGEEEGRLAYVATRVGLGLNKGPLVVFDTGGGSSQFTFGHDASVDERFSVDVGAVRYTESYRLDRAVSPKVLREAMEAISADLSRLEGRPVPDALVGMGGAMTNIAAVKHRLAAYDPAVIQGTVLDRAESIARSSSTGRVGCRRPPGYRRPPAEPVRSHPRRRLHRPYHHGEAGQAELRRERPRSAPRRAGRTIRNLTGVLGVEEEISR